MRTSMQKLLLVFVTLTFGVAGVHAQDGATVVAANSEAAAGLDLYAVAELFKNSETLEKFEQSLNDPKTGINNLDLDQNGEVDFLRVTEKTAGDTHLIILQTPINESDFQDVATIAVDRESGERYNLHIQGDAGLYGANYYVVPVSNNFGAWNVVRWIFRPNYLAYVSPYGYTVLPRWWNVRHPIASSLYRNRTAVFVGKRNFVASRVVAVRTVNKINYHPRSATVVTKTTNVTRATTAAKPGSVVQTRTVTTTKTKPATQTTTTRTKTRVTRVKH